jgi:hypothetical protein
MGMAAAFTAIADDATAAAWNAAGLSQLERPEVSVVHDSLDADLGMENYENRVLITDFSSRSTVTIDRALDYATPSFLSLTYPFRVGGRVIVTQLSARRLAQFPEVMSRRQAQSESSFGDFERSSELSTTVSGGIDTYSFSLGVEIIERELRLGATVNYLDAESTWATSGGGTESSTGVFGGDGEPIAFEVTGRQREDFSDWFLNLGLQWLISEKLTFGAVYHTEFTTDYERSEMTITVLEDGGVRRSSRGAEGEVRWPDGFSVGLAFRPIDALTLALDYSRTSWSEAGVEEPSGRPHGFPNLDGRNQDSDSWHLGGEWVLPVRNLKIPLRAGFFAEDQIGPTVAELEGFSTDLDEITGFALGVGVGYSGSGYALIFDLAWVQFEVDDRVRFEFSDPDDPFQVPGIPMETLTADVGFSGDRLISSLVVRF